MSDKDQKPDKSGFSLQNEIKKRKTQEVQRAIEQKRVTEARGEASPKADPRRTSQTSGVVPSAKDPKRTSQTTNAAPSADPRRATQTVRSVTDPRRTSQAISLEKRATQTISALANHSRRNLFIAAIATILVIVVLGGSVLLAMNSSSNTVQPTSTPVPLRAVKANDVIDYLKKAGVPVLALREIPVDRASWIAEQEMQFDVQRGANKATFILLSYASRDWIITDSFKAIGNAKFKNWQMSIMSNVLLLSSPDAAPDIKTEISSHLTSYLLVPYRPFLPTPTPPPTATALPTTPAGITQATP
jgi:hypothetical protein